MARKNWNNWNKSKRDKSNSWFFNRSEALAVKEAGNFEEVEVKVSRAKLDEKGNKVTELAKSKNGNEYLKVVRETTTEKRKKDMPSKLNARRKIMNTINLWLMV